jgi:seryl-tRNA synthetase
MGKYTVSAEDYDKLTTLAKQSYSAVAEAQKLKDENRRLSNRIWSLESEVSRLRATLAELKEKCQPYIDALKAAPKAVKEFIDGILEKFKKQEKDIMYDPIPAGKAQPLKQGKSPDYER